MIRRRLRVAASDDSGAAMLIVLFAILLATTLSVAVLGVVLNQSLPTLLRQKEVRTAHAAETGLNVALSAVHAASQPDPLVTGLTIGDRTKLPCTLLSGNVDGSPGVVTYSVTVRYYNTDPTGQTAAWRASATNLLSCPLATQPRYALLVSEGKAARSGRVGAAQGNRRMELVYDFSVDDVNVTGGQVKDGSRCWDAQTAAPGEGQGIVAATCATGSLSQLFTWRDDLTIVLTSTTTSTPLCVTADRVGGSQAAKLMKCDGTLHQYWGKDDTSNLFGYPAGVSPKAKHCLRFTANVLVSESGSGCPVWAMPQSAGSGRSGSPSATKPGVVMQWVNYAEYGRCIDINNWRVERDIILYPCKQDPDVSSLKWNQGTIWEQSALDSTTTPGAKLSRIYTYNQYPTTGTFFTQAQSAGSPQVCLQTDATGAPLRFSTCNASKVEQRWTVNRETGNPLTSYTIVDVAGRCLDVSPVNADTNPWSGVRATTCTGGSSQRWNAPSSFTLPKLKNFRETTGESS